MSLPRFLRGAPPLPNPAEPVLRARVESLVESLLEEVPRSFLRYQGHAPLALILRGPLPVTLHVHQMDFNELGGKDAAFAAARRAAQGAVAVVSVAEGWVRHPVTRELIGESLQAIVEHTGSPGARARVWSVTRDASDRPTLGAPQDLTVAPGSAALLFPSVLH